MNESTKKQRVVVTGLGLVTPIGHNVPDSWGAILNGKSGLGDFTLFDRGEHTVGGVFEVKDFNPDEYLGRRDARRRDRYQQLATVAAKEAMAQSGLEITDNNRERVGVFTGTGIGGIQTLIEQEHVLDDKGLRRLSPFGITMIMANGAGGMLAIDYGIHGPTPTIATACASGNDALGYAYKAIAQGELDAIIAGGTESMLVSVAIGGFERAGATSTKSSGAPQPFDKHRDGLIPGEGAGMLILESLDHAKDRGANILAEIIGYGQTTDAYHITAPAEGGEGAVRAIRMALNDARLDPTEVDYISAHGTGTPLNDVYETMAIKSALGERAYDTAISSTKSMTGHIMGATGAIEAVFCVLAIKDQVIPPTINYETPDPDCDLDYVPNDARQAKVNITLNHAFGFGGHNSVTATKKFDG
jgi:3-oxoacyl-[acyl-carrier-protein] synthase II